MSSLDDVHNEKAVFSVDADSLDMIRIVPRGSPDPFKQVPQLVALVRKCIDYFDAFDQWTAADEIRKELEQIKNG